MEQQCLVDEKYGLTRDMVEKRKAAGQTNTVSTRVGKTEREIIREQVLSFFNLVFIILAAVLVIGGSSVKNMTFMLVVLANTCIGIVQQIRAKRAVDKLSLVAARPVKAIREGAAVQLRQEQLVLDDIVMLKGGDQLCADGVLRSGSLRVNESLITGEADAVDKAPGDALKSGSFVISGQGRYQLTAVGDDGFAAKLAAKAKADPKAAKSEMMRSLDKLIRVVGFGLIPIGILLFYQEFFVLQLSLRESTEATVAALVGMIPEGLYLLTSVAMAVSAMKLTKSRVLVQDMNCIESLARVDVLCVDKTGTITEPAMDVEDVVPLTEEPPELLQSVLCSLYADGGENDTAAAIAELFHGSAWPCSYRIPFESAHKWTGGEFPDHGAFLAGAPEFILGDAFPELTAQVTQWAQRGLRVLLVAGYDGQPRPGALEPRRLRPLALILLSNRIRASAPKTFAYFKSQGVTVKVISGDNPTTVSRVALRAGIENAESYVDAGALETEADYLRAVEEYTVFGRVTPDQKKKLIRAMKKQKHTVAMTGDGVNDVLAMKEAHCGIAMASGAQAANQVAQLVLLDNDFGAMPDIVGEGRRVINNIQRAATLFLVKNIFSLGLAIISLFTQWPYPLLPLHLSVISALTIGIPSFFLAMEPNYERVSGRFIPGVLRRAFPGGLTNIFVVLMAQAFMVFFGMELSPTQTICTAILSVVGMLVLFQTCKPFDKFRMLIWSLMGLALIACFVFFRSLLDLQISGASVLVMLVLLIMTPTVFFAIQRIFDFFERILFKKSKKAE